MGSTNAIVDLRDALKLSNSIDASEKLAGLEKLDSILKENNPQLVELGYDKVLLNELIKFIKFEEGESLRATLDLTEHHYFSKLQHQDMIMESLLYRYGLSTNNDVSLACLKKISSLIDAMDDNVAKHAKQILQLSDITLPDTLRQQVEEILLKIECKLPRRKC